jgi:16S rRNA (uracil1498-N3)-methyltransferase
MSHPKIRVFVDQPLSVGNSVSLDRDHANYLFNVMRLSAGAVIALFNGVDGEFAAEIVDANKRRGIAVCREQTKPLQMPPDLWLLFAPIKKARTDFIVEKAAEMGAARIVPIQTDFTNSERVRQDRLQLHAVEAAEQCGGTYVPEVGALVKLGKMLDEWPENRQLLFCDEARVGPAETLGAAAGGKWAIIIGPEGGFSDAERSRLNAMAQTTAVSLGPRILRADTAAVAALTVWQSTLGDWV